MYVSYKGDDLGRQSLHLRPSTVEENQASGVYNTQSKRKRGYDGLEGVFRSVEAKERRQKCLLVVFYIPGSTLLRQLRADPRLSWIRPVL